MKTICNLWQPGWLVVALAIFNGWVREKTYGRVMRELSAHQLSTLTGLLFFSHPFLTIGHRPLIPTL